LTISGEGRKNDASTYDICLSVNREQTLTIGLNFQGPFHGGRLSGLQVESSARFIMRTIENYLRSNREAVVRPAPSEKPRLAYALPSLFMAGSSQFLSAHHRESSWKNWRYWLGTALAAGQITALGKAAAYDHDAVRGVNDRDAANARLDKRNDCLYTAAGIALSSALISVLDVLFFKRK
jgi:hypothetical protein